MSDEIESHIQMQTEENQRAGMSAEEARRRAILKLGGVERTRQAYRERDTLPLIENLLQDLRFAFRQLGKNPGFAVTAIADPDAGHCGECGAVCVCGCGAAEAAAVSRSRTGWWRCMRAPRSFAHSNLSYPDYLDWKRMNKSFQSLDAWHGNGYALRASDGVEPVPGSA